MADAFKRKLAGFQGPSRRASRHGQCPCCAQHSNKCADNRIARARMVEEERALATEGEATYRDERAEQANPPLFVEQDDPHGA